MTKQEQIDINNAVAQMCLHINKNGYRAGYYVNLRSCQAKTYNVCHKETGEFLGVALMSYETTVAFIDTDGVCYDFLRLVYGYTATSAMHIAKFKADFHARATYTYRPV